MRTALRRAYYFTWAYFCVLRIHQVMRRRGFAGVRDEFLKPRTAPRIELEGNSGLLDDIGWAVETACKRWRSGDCLHRAVATYHLLSREGFSPVFVIATQGKPFGPHAWVHVADRIVADEEGEGRSLFEMLLRIPQN
jgi:hypothetical protein